MLEHELNGNIIHVTQTTHSANDTEVEHWYYDIQNWRVSTHGREGDVPSRDMAAFAIKWCIEHHIPKVIDTCSVCNKQVCFEGPIFIGDTEIHEYDVCTHDSDGVKVCSDCHDPKHDCY